MSNKDFESKCNEQKAAHMLMTDFVKNNADLVAKVLEPIVGLWGEVTYETLKNDVSVVSQVFAGVALQLIDHNDSLDRDDPDNMILPVGAKTMNSTIEGLAKMTAAMRSLFVLLIDKYYDNPAFEMSCRAFYKYEAQM